MTIADQLILLNNTKTAIAAAIENKGVMVGEIPFADFPSKIDEISAGGSASGWVRPADWLELPEVLETDQKFVGLHAIWPDANFIALSAAGAYTVDWGDGVVENFAANAVAQHEYNYATYDVGGATMCSRGYKQAIVVVTPQLGQVLSVLNLHRRHSALAVMYSSGFLDIALASAALTDLSIGVQTPGNSLQYISHSYLENANVVSANVANFSNLLQFSVSLQNFTGDTSAVLNMSNMFNNCYSLTSVPLFHTAAVTNMSNMFSNCRSLTSVPLFHTAAVTNMSNMFNNCYSLTSVPLFHTAAVTNMSNMFSNCSSLTSVPLFNTSAVTDMSYMFGNCFSLTSVGITGTKISFSVASCKLSAARLNEIYTNLATVTGQTLTVTGNYGVSGDNPSIATAKGWTVTG